MRIDLPYDTKTVPLTIGEQNLEKIVISHISEASGEGTQEEMARRACGNWPGERNGWFW